MWLTGNTLQRFISIHLDRFVSLQDFIELGSLLTVIVVEGLGELV